MNVRIFKNNIVIKKMYELKYDKNMLIYYNKTSK